MKFIRKHYEKFIFILFLILFVILFGWQAYSEISKQDQTQEEKLKIISLRPDYGAINFEDEKYKANMSFSKASVKLKPGQLQDNLNIDLVVPPVLAVCPEGAHLIPITDFPESENDKNKKCSFCNIQLKDVPLAKLDGVDATGKVMDSDNDGIPDVDERRIGLNPNKGEDAAEDKDQDGFTNLEEYRSKTDISNPKSRPPYSKKLYVKSIKESKIGIRIMRFSSDKGKNEADPTKWGILVSYNLKDKRGTIRQTTKNLKVGRELKNAGNNPEDYVVERIEPKFDDNRGERKNVSVVVLKRIKDGQEFFARVGEEVFDPRKEIVLEVDLPFVKDKEISTVIGQEFSIGNNETGVDTFTAVEAVLNPRAEKPEDRMTVKLKNKATGFIDVIKTRQDNTYGGNPEYSDMPRRPDNSMPKF